MLCVLVAVQQATAHATCIEPTVRIWPWDVLPSLLTSAKTDRVSRAVLAQKLSSDKGIECCRLRHLHDFLEPQRQTVIVDIGANPINPAPYDIVVEAGFAHVFGFEPQQSAFEKLQNAPQANRTYLPYAIGDGNTATLYECRHSGFTSLLKPNPDIVSLLGRWEDHLTITDEIEIQTLRLDDVEQIARADFLKMDVQGSELTILQNGTRLVKEAIAVMSEIAAVPIYLNQPLMHEQIAELHSLDFSLHKFDFFKDVVLGNSLSPRLRQRRHSNQLVDGDAIFLRSLMRLERLEPEELKHMALLADAVFHSYDLVLKIIEVLELSGHVQVDSRLDDYIDLLPFVMKRPQSNPDAQPEVRSMSKQISLVLIAFNNEKYIEEALLSALNQEPPFEQIIVVDDASTDDTSGVIARVCDAHTGIIALKHDRNRGPGAARNTGMERVTSPYFCFLDGDDRFAENAMSSMQHFIEDVPSADMFVFKGKSLNKKGKTRVTGGVEPGIYETLEEKKPVFHSVTFPWNKLYRTRWINEKRIRFGPGKYEDIPWCYECTMAAGKIAAFDAPLVWYRIHSQSTLQRRSDHQLDVLDQWERTLKLVRETPDTPKSFIRFVELDAFLQMSRMLLFGRIPRHCELDFAQEILRLVGELERMRTDFSYHPKSRRVRKRLQRFEKYIQQFP